MLIGGQFVSLVEIWYMCSLQFHDGMRNLLAGAAGAPRPVVRRAVPVSQLVRGWLLWGLEVFPPLPTHLHLPFASYPLPSPSLLFVYLTVPPFSSYAPQTFTPLTLLSLPLRFIYLPFPHMSPHTSLHNLPSPHTPALPLSTYLTSSLEPRLSILDFVSQLWRKIGPKLRNKIPNGKPGFEAI